MGALIPIDIPPGVVRNGTQFQVGTKGRWYDANLVRWIAGILAPVGGWTRRDTGVVPGMCRDLFAWRDNSVNRWLVVGSNEGMYVAKTGSDTLHDITPAGFTAGRVNAIRGFGYGYGAYGASSYGTARADAGGRLVGAAGWSFDNWGQYLIACAPHDGRIVEWQLDTATVATVVANAPTDCKGAFVTPERHLVAIAVNGDPRRVSWSDREDNTVWTPATTNLAGSYDLQTNGEIQVAVRVRGQTLILTTQDVFSMQFVGSPYVYGFERVSGTGGTSSPRSAVGLQGRAVWMANDGFYIFDGLVTKMACDVEDYVLSDINADQFSKVIGGHNREFSEVWWFYPSAASVEPDRYVVWNYRENHWSIGRLARTAFASPGVLELPLMASTDGYLYDHETGWTDDGAALGADRYVESGAVDAGDGDRVLRATRLIPDEKTQGQTQVVFKTRFTPNGPETEHGPYALTDYTDVRFSGRQVAVRIEAVADDNWRVGIMRLDAQKAGKR